MYEVHVQVLHQFREERGCFKLSLSFSLTRRLTVVAETGYQQSLGVNDHDRFGADPVHSVQGGQFLRFRVVESPWYPHIPEVHLRYTFRVDDKIAIKRSTIPIAGLFSSI